VEKLARLPCELEMSYEELIHGLIAWGIVEDEAAAKNENSKDSGDRIEMSPLEGIF